MTGSAAPAAYDLVVVGAGPAGASAAIAARHADPSARVLLLDRDDFPRDKSCGDGIAPLVFDALAEVGVHDLTDGWTPLRHLALGRDEHRVSRAMRRSVWVIPRAVLDARLVERAVDAGVELRRHRVRAVREDSDGVTVDDAFRARVLVAADGADSPVRRALGMPPTGRRALAIRGYAPTPPGRRGRQEIVYGDRTQPSYAWSFDRGDGLANVGYGELVGHGPASAPTRALLLEQLERLLPGATDGATDWRAHHLPLSGRHWPHPSGRVLLAGDAAGLVNPMTGEGIYYAVATGIRAGQVAAAARGSDPDDPAAAYARAVRRLLGRHLRHTWAASRLSARPRMVDAGIRAAARRAPAFDDLVEIGLGRGTITPGLAGGLVVELAVELGLDLAGRGARS